MGYSSLRIERFRAIGDLKLGNFKRVNVITGRNNCGKTTVLEALFQISGMSNPQLPVTIHNIRNLTLTSDNNFNFIFRNLDFKNEPNINAVLDGVKRNLVIRPRYASQHTMRIGDGKTSAFVDAAGDGTTRPLVSKAGDGRIRPLIANTTEVDSDGFANINGLSLEYSDGRINHIFVSEISFLDGEIVTDNRYKEKLKCSFHSSLHSMSMLPQRMERLRVNKQMSGIISSLNEIDSAIADIHIGAAGVIYVDVGLDKLLPLNIVGDGIRRILSTLASVSDMQGGVLLIDEIENGLHYSSLEILWKSLLKAAQAYNVQLFVTTHSNECIKALSTVAMQNKDDIQLYRIERNKNSHRAFEYPADMIMDCLEENIEMR